MIILSHRGYWKSANEKNTLKAFTRSFSMGFGIETDVRDHNGTLVISHEIACARSVPLTEMLTAYKENQKKPLLALNVKSCGLAKLLEKTLGKYNVTNYFLFDIAFPDMLEYLKLGMQVFSRQSEYEKIPLAYDKASGVWMDGLASDWIDGKTIARHLASKKRVCIVSPELHHRPYLKKWACYNQLQNTLKTSSIILCTDHPEKARRFFSE